PEVPHFDEPRLSRVDFFEPLECVFQCEYPVVLLRPPIGDFRQCDLGARAALGGATRPRRIHKNLAHQPRGHSIKMRAILVRRVMGSPTLSYALGQQKSSLTNVLPPLRAADANAPASSIRRKPAGSQRLALPGSHPGGAAIFQSRHTPLLFLRKLSRNLTLQRV